MGIIVPLLSAFVLGQLSREWPFDATADIHLASLYYRHILASGTSNYVGPTVMALYALFVCRDYVRDGGWQPAVLVGSFFFAGPYFYFRVKPHEDKVAYEPTAEALAVVATGHVVLALLSALALVLTVTRERWWHSGLGRYTRPPTGARLTVPLLSAFLLGMLSIDLSFDRGDVRVAGAFYRQVVPSVGETYLLPAVLVLFMLAIGALLVREPGWRMNALAAVFAATAAHVVLYVKARRLPPRPTERPAIRAPRD